MGPVVLLKQLMRSLCHNTVWNFSVFWKIKQKNDILSWEDGYCDNLKSAVSIEESNRFCAGTSRTISFGCKKDVQNRDSISTEFSLELAVANLSNHLYVFGEGIIGTVAFTGEHLWIIVDINFLSEYPEEWRLQIASGVKTILLVPVPDGVIQLGSLEVVAENLSTVNYIKHLFSSLEDASGLCSHPMLGGSITPFLTPPVSSSAFSITTTGFPFHPLSHPLTKKHKIGFDKIGFDAEQVTRKEQSNSDHHISPPIIIPDNLPSSQADMQQILGTRLELHIDEFSRDPVHSIFMPEDNSVAPSQDDDFDHMILSFLKSCEMQVDCGQYDSFSMDEISLSFVNGLLEDDIDHEPNPCVINLPTDPVVQALQMPSLHESIDNQVWTSSSSPDQSSGSPDACEVYENFHKNLTFGEYNDFSFVEKEENVVLDRMASVPRYSFDEHTQNSSRLARSSSNLAGELLGSCLTEDKSEISALKTSLLGSPNDLDTIIVTNDALTRSPTLSSSKSGGSLVINEDNHGDTMYRNVAIKKSNHTGKKKSKPGDTHKPRPRDRQLIQDRVKELRELVPQGEKCSIDALLERTIKHMLFLKSVSIQAERLKNCAHPKSSEENRSSVCQPNSNGATWAYELGSKHEVCPILVENLEQPGHVLVEMLCTEYGDFLEIAQVIRHSELVILKGGMECRNDKLWAFFIVEASRGFDRMDILWPLMRLMQRGGCPVTSVF